MAAAPSVAATRIAPVLDPSAARDNDGGTPADSGTESSTPPSPTLAAADDLRISASDAAFDDAGPASASNHTDDATTREDTSTASHHANDGTTQEDTSGPVNRQPSMVDIEHLPVEDDPRLWSARRKGYVL